MKTASVKKPIGKKQPGLGSKLDLELPRSGDIQPPPGTQSPGSQSAAPLGIIPPVPRGTRPLLEPGIADPTRPSIHSLGPVKLAPAKPALRRDVPDAQVVHATQIFPEIADNIDPRTGEKLPTRERTGGQFSCRLLVLVNRYDAGQVKRLALPMHLQMSDWPIPSHMRVCDPRHHAGDPCHGNYEVVFDFQDQMFECLRALGPKNLQIGFDPLKMNDWTGHPGVENLRTSGVDVLPPPGAPGFQMP